MFCSKMLHAFLRCSRVSPEVQYMDKLFEDDIKLFCVDVVLNHFGGLKERHSRTLYLIVYITVSKHPSAKHGNVSPVAVPVSGSRSEL